jgi:hypothetical protein
VNAFVVLSHSQQLVAPERRFAASGAQRNARQCRDKNKNETDDHGRFPAASTPQRTSTEERLLALLALLWGVQNDAASAMHCDSCCFSYCQAT